MDDANIRMERIQRLLKELQYEVTRGMLEHEVDEHLGFVFYVPVSRQVPDGVVRCSFETRPTTRASCWPTEPAGPRLRVIR